MSGALLNEAEATHQRVAHPSHAGATEGERRAEAAEHKAYQFIRLSNTPNSTDPPAYEHVPFGEVCGRAPSGVPAFSNGSDTHFSNEKALWDRQTVSAAAESSLGRPSSPDTASSPRAQKPFCTGYKWQCVEFARRWLLQHRNILLPDVQIAAHIFYLEQMLHVPTGSHVAVRPIANGTFVPPQAGSLIIYPQSNEGFVGHVGVIVEAAEGYVRVADQNRFFHNWGDAHYSAEFTVERDEEGRYWIRDDVMAPAGWVTFPAAPGNAVTDAFGTAVPLPVEHSTVRGVLYAGINAPLPIAPSSVLPADSDSSEGAPPLGEGPLLAAFDDAAWLSTLSVPIGLDGGEDLGACVYLKFWGRSMAAFKGKVLFAATLGRILSFLGWRMIADGWRSVTRKRTAVAPVAPEAS